jgi:glucose/arabinose dehydrogenase
VGVAPRADSYLRPMTRPSLSRCSSVVLLFGAACALPACEGGTTTANTGGSGATGGGTTSTTGGGGTSTGGSGGSAGATSSGGATTSSTTGGGDPCPPDPSGPVPPLTLTLVAFGLELPVYATGAPGDTERLFILEQNGRIRVLRNGVVLPEPFLDLTNVVQGVEFNGDERGLLGLAFHPEYAQNGRFFVHYTDQALDHGTIVEFHATPGSDIADAAPVKTLFTVTTTQYGNHNGGQLAFGPDGHLYIGFGDGGQANDPDGNGQDVGVELGKILRIDPDTFPTPVAGNLNPGFPHIWDYGLRNPWRFSFDRCTGDLYIGDVGQGAFEEVDVEPAGQGLKNYGWDIMEGNDCHEPPNNCDMSGLTPPTVEYSHNSGGCSVTGGYVYRGSKIPNLVGTYFYGDYCSKQVWTFRYQGGAAVDQQEITADLDTLNVLQALSSFGEDTLGELYVVDLAGSVYRIDPE